MYDNGRQNKVFSIEKIVSWNYDKAVRTRKRLIISMHSILSSHATKSIGRRTSLRMYLAGQVATARRRAYVTTSADHQRAVLCVAGCMWVARSATNQTSSCHADCWTWRAICAKNWRLLAGVMRRLLCARLQIVSDSSRVCYKTTDYCFKWWFEFRNIKRVFNINVKRA
jgi:hypothetical protein